MRKFVPMPEGLIAGLRKVRQDDQLAEIGFICQGPLNAFEGFDEFEDDLWIWAKIDDNKIYILVSKDGKDDLCSVYYVDMYVVEIVEKMMSM